MAFPLAAVSAAPERRRVGANAPPGARHGSPDRVGLVVIDVATRRSHVLLRGRYFEYALSPDGRMVYVLGRNDAVSIPK